MFEEKIGMLMWREWRTTVSQRSPEIIVHGECGAEEGRRNDGRKVSTQLPRPKFWKNRRWPKEMIKKKKKIHILVCIRAMMMMIMIIIIIIGSTALDGPWPPQSYHQAVCITAITITVQVHIKIYTLYVGSHSTLMTVTPSCCFGFCVVRSCALLFRKVCKSLKEKLL